jgi:hypothetical protein
MRYETVEALLSGQPPPPSGLPPWLRQAGPSVAVRHWPEKRLTKVNPTTGDGLAWLLRLVCQTVTQSILGS